MRRLFYIFSALTLWVNIVGCVRDGSYKRYEGAVWNTTFHITYDSPRLLDDSMQTVMSRVELSLSPFCDSSLVSDINACRSMVTDSLFRRVFTTALQVSRVSGGLYDPTVGPLVELWGFGRHKGVEEPSQRQIDSARMSVGIARCRLEGGLVVKPSPATYFDFSSITKGYGCDLIGEMLRRNGCGDYMVEIGGEMALSGTNPRGEKWRVMVEAPVDDDTTQTRRRMTVIEVTDCGVATSGNYRNYRDFDSGRKGHTISPLTGRPVKSNTLSATVIAPDAMTADALATACMAMDIDEALAMVEAWEGAEAMLVTIGDDGGWLMRTTAGFPELKD